jgi:D-arabinose 1-dehydrogenase-like Zn-dependent alcohol dehydrogenase
LVIWQVRRPETVGNPEIIRSIVQYGRANGAQVIGVDGGSDKQDFVFSLGAQEYIDFRASPNVVEDIRKIINGGAHAVVVAAGSPKAFTQAAEMLRVGGTLSCVGIPPGKTFVETPVSSIVIKGLRITGNLVGSLKECLEAVELVRRGTVKPKISVRPFRDLPAVYEEMEKGEVTGRIVLKIGDE